MTDTDPAGSDHPDDPRDTDALHERIATCTKPIVAALHGLTGGNGLELALAASLRIATPASLMTLPEVARGLIPGAGGTQRLTHLVGVEAALAIIVGGERVTAERALHIGLVDAIASPEALLDEAMTLARRAATGHRHPRAPAGNAAADDGHATQAAIAVYRAKHQRRFRGQHAFEAAIACIAAATTLPLKEGLALERAHFDELARGEVSAALKHLTAAERAIWTPPGLPKRSTTPDITRVGIVGAGTMGGGIAMCFLNIGLPVALVETDRSALDRGISAIRRTYETSAGRGSLDPATIEPRMALLQGTVDLEDLAPCDLLIEAVYEDMAIKKALFAKLDRIARPGAILATNTSALNVNEIATAVSRPEAIVGLHFFSPANVIRLLEIVRAAKTSPEVIASSLEIARRIGKLAVVVGVGPGFVANRLLFYRQGAAHQLVMEGTSPWHIDALLTAFGFPMGPFAMSDLAGLDIGWSAERSTGSTLTEVLCEMGRKGQKTRAGFYDYDTERRPSPSMTVEAAIAALRKRHGIVACERSDREVLERCLLPMVNEGARLIQDGIAQSASDIDVIWTSGFGWPRHEGGPMFYGERLGLDYVLSRMREFERENPRLAPAPLLEQLVSEQRGFASIG